MNVFNVIFSSHFVVATILHSVLILTGIIIFEFLHTRYKHSLLDFLWEKVGMPLYRAIVISIFVFVSYPIIFGLSEAPNLSTLLATGDGRVMNVINVLFVISLLFPLVPVLGKHNGLVLPVQAIICCAMIFSWLARYYRLDDYQSIPDFNIVLIMLVVMLCTYYLATWTAHEFGEKLDKRFHLEGCQELIAPSIILFMQFPVILLYSFSLGKQLFPVIN